MAGYIGSKASVTQVDGYNTTEADAEFLNQTEGDARYVELAGDTLTGALTGTDLTLSGGVYLGGTGSANKLDDYEEGTFTPTADQGLDSITVLGATYVKIGGIVFIHCALILNGDTSANQVTIGGLPFAHSAASSNDGRGNAFVWLDQCNIGTGFIPIATVSDYRSDIRLFKVNPSNNENQGNVVGSNLENGSEFQVNINYRV